MNPLVAVTTGVLEKGGSHDQPQVVLYASYMSVLDDVGLAPVLLTPVHSPAAVRAVMAHCSGLVLTGGEDVDPRRYGEEPIEALGAVTPARDELESAALGLALERDLPVLGICRGCQLLNVYFGGTLYQDLPTQRPGTGVHEQPGWAGGSHDVRVQPGSRLHGIVAGPELWLNSFHHQAIRDVAPGLEVVALADDGVVEAVEARDHAWVIGVQWHPERHEASAPDGDPDRLLFGAFRQAVLQAAEAG
jgi:putative glutamine amidotransferase